MASSKWDTIDIDTSEGRVNGVAPVIISASRSTDIPAFYSEWFINRLREGYVKWVNPFNGKPQYISFDNARIIIFWTKDAQPLIPYLEHIDNKGINYYFSYTLNDYEKEGFEKKVRKLDKRIETFKILSEKIGKEKVIWRFDPLILTDKITVEDLLDRILKVGNQVADYTNKLVISFADISAYRKVKNNLLRHNVNYEEFTHETMEAMAKGLNEINRDWGLDIATCSEDIDLSKYNIKKNKCIDDDLLIRLFPQDEELMSFLGCGNEGGTSMSNSRGRPKYEEMSLFDLIDSKNETSMESGPDNNCYDKSKKLKDKGQRESCGCIASKDIGQYDTCSHQCIYCYANSSPQIAADNYLKYLKSDRNGESIL